MMKRSACVIAVLLFALAPASAADRGWSASNFLRLASAVVTTAPLTVCVWAKTSITAVAQTLFVLQNSASGGTVNNFSIFLGTGNAVDAGTSDGSTISFAATSTTMSANTWFHACGVWASATSRAAYLNGGGKGTNAVSRVPTGINRTSFGASDALTVTSPFAPAGTGDIAWPSIWNIALSDADIAELATGVDPRIVHPEAIVAFWPLDGLSPEPNVVSTSTLGVQGTLSASNDPPLFRVH